MSPVLSRFHDDERDGQEKKHKIKTSLSPGNMKGINRQFSEGLPLFKKHLYAHKLWRWTILYIYKMYVPCLWVFDIFILNMKGLSTYYEHQADIDQWLFF